MHEILINKLLLEINSDIYTTKQLLDKGRVIESKITEFFGNDSY